MKWVICRSRRLNRLWTCFSPKHYERCVFLTGPAVRCASLVKLFYMFHPVLPGCLIDGLSELMAFSLTCAIRGDSEPESSRAGRRSAGGANVTRAPPHDFVTLVYSAGLRGALPRTIRGSIDWGTLFSAEHLVQSMTFAPTLTTSVSTAPQLLSNHSAVFIAWKRLGKGPFEVCETLDFSWAFYSLKNPFHLWDLTWFHTLFL